MPNWSSETDPDVLSEAALAKAQHLMSHAMTKSGTSQRDADGGPDGDDSLVH